MLLIVRKIAVTTDETSVILLGKYREMVDYGVNSLRRVNFYRPWTKRDTI
jgi:hypothetical protein